MSNLNRRLRLDLATLLSAVAGEAQVALGPLLAGREVGDLKLQVTEIDLTLPIRCTLAGTALGVQLPSRLAPQVGAPGSLALRLTPEEKG